MIYMDRQESLLIERVAGTRRPRTGSCRKPRSKPHPFVGTVCADTLSPLASSPSSGSSYGKVVQQEDGQYPLRSLGGLLGQQDRLTESISSIANGLQSEIGGQGLKCLKPCSNSSMMGDGESKVEWKIFQRRHKRREDSSHTVGLNGSNRQDMEVSNDVLGKGVSMEGTMYDGSPEHANTNNFEEACEDKLSSQKSSKDLAYHPSSKHLGRFAKEDYSVGDKCQVAPSVQSRKERGRAFAKAWEVQDRVNDSYADHVYKGSISTYQDKRGKMVNQKGREQHAMASGKRGSHLCGTMGSGSKGGGKKVHGMHSIHSHERISTVDRPPTMHKLKVGGTNVTHLKGSVQSDNLRHNNQGGRKLSEGVGSLKKPSSATDSRKWRQRLILQDDSDEEVSDFSIVSREETLEKDTSVQNGEGNAEHEDETNEEMDCRVLDSGTSKRAEAIENNTRPLPAVRKSSRVPKKRILDGDDIELEPKRRRRKKNEMESADDQCWAEEGEGNSVAGELEVASASEFPPRRKRQFKKKDELHTPELDGKKDIPLTARQRALKSSKEGGDSESRASVIEFPEGITPLLHKKQKENLTEAEQAIKKEEAARKRRQQLEKNVKEIQAVAIQKILGQDSTRKKREEKLQKQRQEIEQEKHAAAMMPAFNSIRWVMGPSGNVVSFSQDLELPSIFSGPCSYPKERERCAAPACNNVYKYRDSKTLLPLCSLPCYKAVKNLPSMASAF